MCRCRAPLGWLAIAYPYRCPIQSTSESTQTRPRTSVIAIVAAVSMFPGLAVPSAEGRVRAEADLYRFRCGSQPMPSMFCID